MATIGWAQAHEERKPFPWRAVLHWAVVGTALGWVAWRIPGMVSQFTETGVHVDHVRWGWLLVAVLSGAGALAVYGELHRKLLVVGGVSLPSGTVQGINFAQNAVSTTVPVVGGAGSLGYGIQQLRRRGVSGPVAAWSVLMAGLITSVSLIVIGALGLAIAGELPAVVAVPIAVVLGGGTFGAWQLLSHPAVLRHGLLWITPRRWAARAESAAIRLSDNVASLRPNGREWPVLVAVALLTWVLDFVTLVASVLTVDVQIPWAALVVGFLIVQGSIALQILPGGAGLAETGLLGVLLSAGIAAAPAGAIVLFYRAITWLGLAVIGWAVYALLPRRLSSTNHS
ncbi:lysylphosphatidylglycerol synthase transmembrane domain-containing protein [Kutzneria sp. CA-103260]|uniref:lysylphosphatidylglycerol synthase transmembrane domain-containing protein n=1 Tax=Kutzneria sp. CA-103260 TaxID=2802641 RepID=UPI001BA8A373|nr:lysylphosphatidylglycerol synthase transmembrane domain-containing protein [Kutzneria sp. CA-103260]QUQ65938.1 Lysylphosphatidylglycerol synthase TM region [Kutzneria sp. CA-103260]